MNPLKKREGPFTQLLRNLHPRLSVERYRSKMFGLRLCILSSSGLRGQDQSQL